MSRAARAALTVALPALSSGCLLLGNPCGNKSDGEEYLNSRREIEIGQIGTEQGDGTWLVSPIDCAEACERFGNGADGLKLLELDTCELRIHPVLEDPLQVEDNGSPQNWTRVEAIEEPVTVPAEWRTYEVIVIAECPGTYRTECKN